MNKFSKENAKKQLLIERGGMLGLSMSFTIVLSFMLGIVGYFCINNMIFTALLIFISFLTGTFFYLFLSRKIRSDMKSGNVNSIHVTAKQVCINNADYEAGSGMLYMPVLASIFPKMYGQKMRETKKSYLITNTNEKYEISSDENSEKQEYELYFGEKSNVYLGYK